MNFTERSQEPVSGLPELTLECQACNSPITRDSYLAEYPGSLLNAVKGGI